MTAATAIQHLLKDAAARARFSQSDLSVWLECSRPNVIRYLTTDAQPLPYREQHIRERVKLLDKVLGRKKSPLPVPPAVTQHQRREYIEGIRDRALKGIFSAGSSD